MIYIYVCRGGTSMNKIRQMATLFRESADILDEIANNQEDTTISEKEKEEKQEELLARFAVKAMKINAIKM